MTRLGYLARTTSGVGFPPEEQGASHGDLPFLKVSDLADPRNSAAVVTAANWITAAQASRLGVRRVPPGSIIFPKVGAALLGNARALTRIECALDNNMMAVSPHHGDPRYLLYVLRTVDLGELNLSGTLPFVSDSAVRDLDLPLDRGLPEQRRIVDFLDDQVTRIDNIIAARRSQRGLLVEAETQAAWDALTAPELTDRRATTLGWLPSLPSSWPMTTVHAAYSVMLGKMLDESRFTGSHALPYLRNTNVQWDRISTDDLKAMDFAPDERERFSVHAGDLLICEGGQPGRCAVWDGSISPIGYQKALHRARPRGDSDVRWLQLMLRVAVSQNTFAVEFGQATIGHLTGEQLRSLRIPMPPLSVQRSRSDRFTHVQNDLHPLSDNLAASIERLEEFKRALITAAVTGEFDVASADGSRVSA